MSTFDFLFGVIFGSTILRHTDNLSKTLQQKTLSAAEGQHLASLCTDVLRSLRTDEAFAALYARACQDELEYACDFYGDDLPQLQLQTQLPLLRHLFQETAAANVTFHEIVRVLGTLSAAQRLAFSAVWICMKLLLVMPATNATSERSFSALRRVKTYLRTQMTQQRLNHLIVLHVHSDKTDALELLLTAQEFVIGREGRLRMFGDCKQL